VFKEMQKQSTNKDVKEKRGKPEVHVERLAVVRRHKEKTK
jgi:hypothetical protein